MAVTQYSGVIKFIGDTAGEALVYQTPYVVTNGDEGYKLIKSTEVQAALAGTDLSSYIGDTIYYDYYNDFTHEFNEVDVLAVPS